MLHETVKAEPTGVDAAGPGPIAWAATVITLASYLLLMLGVAYAPAFLASPLMDGSVVSVGLAAGVFVLALLIVVSALYTRWRNRKDLP
jgi:uncharacterized membrane protein (DUF485 family)